MEGTPEKAAADAKLAVWVGVTCYTIWGLASLLFLALRDLGVSDWEIVAERGVWAVVWAAALVTLGKQWPETLGLLRKPRVIPWLLLSSACVLFNWTSVTWAVNNGHAMEAAFGFYITPLLSMASGMVLFRERMDGLGWLAIALAVVGVAIQTVALGRLPILSLALALGFALYTVVRKHAAVGAQAGLFVECLILAPAGLAYVVWLALHGQSHLGDGVSVSLLLLMLGPATTVPLVLFVWAARHMPLSSLAFVQFITPTITFFIALAIGEPLTTTSIWSFAFIWAGVAAFIWSGWRTARRVAGA